MHSNGGRDLVPEANSPAVGESRRAGHPAALARRRSLGGKGLIAGASGESLGAISVMVFSALWLSACEVECCRRRLAPWDRAARDFPSRHRASSVLVRVHLVKYDGEAK